MINQLAINNLGIDKRIKKNLKYFLFNKFYTIFIQNNRGANTH